MKEYIDHNVQGRRDTTDPVRRSVHKMCNNALYGRSLMQNSRYNKEVSIVDNELAFQTKVMSPYYINAIPLNEKRLMVVNQKPNILQNSPIFLGLTILDIAKFYMYEFFYCILKPFYGDRCRLLYSDTDSMCLSLPTLSFLDDLERNESLRKYIDFSNFPKEHKMYDDSREGELGCLKLETGEKMIVELVALGPKLYSVLLLDNSTKQTAKGIPKRNQ